MDQYDKGREEKVPEFGPPAGPPSHGALDISATVTAVQIHGWKQVLGILAVAVLVIGGWELAVRLTKVPEFVFPTPSAIAVALVTNMPTVYPPFFITLAELAAGYVIGAAIGLIMAAVLTPGPYSDKGTAT